MYDKCPTCEQNMMNANGSEDFSEYEDMTNDGGGGFDFNQLISSGFGLLSQYGSIKEKEAQQGVTEAEAAAERARAAAERAKGEERAATIKAYALPIAITGILAVGGIAAYFYFKRAKLN